MKLKNVFAIVGATAATAIGITAGAAEAGVFSVNSFDNGWYDNNGYHNTGNANIITGYGDRYRNWGAFDLTGITENIVSAKLIAKPNGRSSSYSGSETWVIKDVLGDIDTLVSGRGGLAAYNDLGSGDVFGQATVKTSFSGLSPMPQIVVDLTESAIASLNAARGLGKWAFGGTCTTCTSSEFLSGYTSTVPAFALEVTTAPVATPEPASMLGLLAVGAVATGAAVKRKKAA